MRAYLGLLKQFLELESPYDFWAFRVPCICILRVAADDEDFLLVDSNLED